MRRLQQSAKMKTNRKEGGLPLLTQQEKKVLGLVAKAHSNKEIAAELRISPSTVKRHLENILRKLQLKNRVAVAVYAVTQGNCSLELGKAQQAA
jgi:DNA-binding NarL/FixJ family response regulator